jgi:DNA-damage-inducible protein D
MNTMSSIKLFESKQVRTYWDQDKQTWYFSVIDVVEVLTESSIPKRYWSDLKTKLQNEGSQVYEEIVRLKMKASDGKLRLTDVAETQTLLRITVTKDFQILRNRKKK